MPFPPSIQARMELETRFNIAKYRAKDPLQCPFKVDMTQDDDGMLVMFCVDEKGQAIEELKSIAFRPNITDVIAA